MSRTALYRLFDTAGQLLYVGIATSPRTRRYAHREEKRWWPQVAREEVEWFPSRTAAKSAEKIAIKAEDPLYNVTHSTTRKRGDAAAENNSKYPHVRTLRIPNPDWPDAVAIAPGGLSSALNQFARWYLRRPGVRLPERPNVEHIAKVIQEREARERALVAEYLSGTTVREIAKREKLNDKSVCDMLRRYGVDV